MSLSEVNYAGFWVRTGAFLIDVALIALVTLPILTLIYGKEYWTSGSFVLGAWDIIFSYIFPFMAIIAFWVCKSATPGKLITKIMIVDAKTGDKPTYMQFIVRYIGYFISSIPLELGFLWTCFDKRKQGWHDKLSRTVVEDQRGRSKKSRGQRPKNQGVRDLDLKPPEASQNQTNLMHHLLPIRI